jgi:GNAT superfamily N-acetyltransferase
MQTLKPTIQKAQEPEIRDAIFRLRFTGLIVEMGMPCPDRVRVEACIQDDADTTGHLFAATTPDGRLVGSILTNLLREGLHAPFDVLLQGIGEEAPPIGTLSVTSRLFVASTHRNTPLAARLALTVYQNGLEQGIDHDVIFVQSVLVPMYLRMGYRNLSIATLWHPQGLEVVPMLLDARDWDYLDRIGSIFRRAPSFRQL